MNKLYFLSLLIILLGCSDSQKRKKENQANKNHSFELRQYKDSIPYNRIEKFDSALWGKYEHAFFPKLYPPIMNEVSLDVFQDSTMYVSSILEGTHSFFSLQTNDGHLGIVIAGMNDNWRNQFLYMSYDNKGKLINSFPLAYNGGDGGFTSIATGEYINDSVYIRHSEEYEHDFMRELNDTIEIEDIKVVFRYNGTIDTLALKK